MTSSAIGETIVCKWRGGAAGAFSISGDDSLRSQLFFAIPEMDKRGIVGTWWVNPGRGGLVNYKKQDDEWAECWIACYQDWVAAASRGHDFGNHTMLHLGASSVAEADREIGECARAIWKSNPRQRLQLFLRGGGTTWTISQAEIDEILERYDCVEGRGDGIECPTWETNPSAVTLCQAVDDAILEGSWHYAPFHGIGPTCEWGGPVDGDAFTALLDHLVEKRGQVWNATYTDIFKYQQERMSVKIDILESSDRQIRLSLTSACDPRLYDYPLTLRTQAPADWQAARISQGIQVNEYTVMDGVLTFEGLPGTDLILIDQL